MANLITPAGVRETIRQLAQTAAFKVDQAEEAFLKHADLRAVQGGQASEEAEEWRKLSRLLNAASVHASNMDV